jgi:hypothetical protein
VANREKGEVSLEIGETSYTLYLDLNAMALLEDYFSTPQKDVTFDEVLQRVNRGSVRHIRAFVWAALQYHHPTITVKEAGDLVQKGGGLVEFGRKVQALGTSTIPDPDDLQVLGVNGNPPQAQAAKRRRGGISTSTPVG